MNEVQLIDNYLKRLTKKNKSSQGLNDDIFFEWVSLLQKADLIKFAKKSTHVSEMEDDKSVALKIINNALN